MFEVGKRSPILVKPPGLGFVGKNLSGAGFRSVISSDEIMDSLTLYLIGVQQSMRSKVKLHPNSLQINKPACTAPLWPARCSFVGLMKLSLALLFSFLVAASAHADFYSDNNPADVWINALNPSYTGEFTLAGYNPAEQAVTWANAEFTFWDLIGNENVKISMGDQTFTNGSFSGFLYLGGDVLANALVMLNNTGALSYTVSRTSGGLSEFWLKNARIDVQTSARGIPDSGATSVLAGLGVVLVISARRWLSRVA